MAKKFIAIIIILTICAMCCGIFCGCSYSATGKQYETYAYFNTASTLVLYGNFANKKRLSEADNIWEEIKAKLATIESALSIEKESSDITKFNQSKGGVIPVEKCTYEIFTIAKEMYHLTDGAFNPTLALYIDLWGFSPRFGDINYQAKKDYDRQNYKSELPKTVYLEGFAALTDFSKVVLTESDDNYYVNKPNDTVTINDIEYTMNINLGGIGKGYATDKVADYLRESGYENGYISVGRSSISLLKNAIKIKDAPSEYDWKVGLVNPYNNQKQYGDLYLSDTCVGTSGDYENFYEYDGKRYSHIIDSSTFYPVDNEISSVTVVGGSATKCDALSTALCVMGLEKAKMFIDKKALPYKYVITYRNGESKQVFVSEDFDNFALSDSLFVQSLEVLS